MGGEQGGDRNPSLDGGQRNERVKTSFLMGGERLPQCAKNVFK